MSFLEILASLLGLANVFLIVRRSVWNYPFAIAMVSLYAVIFHDSQLFSDAGLQIFFVAANIYGWWAWVHDKRADGDIVVKRLSGLQRFFWIAGSIAAIAVWGTFMGRYTTASYPYWDASVAMLSVAGQILMTRRYIDNWHWWIVVNCISIPLYLAKHLYPTAGLYGLFLILAIVGLVEWIRAERKIQATS